MPAEIKKSLELWVGCVAGALSDYDYVAKLAKAGFDNIDIDSTRVYGIEDARAFLSGQGLDVDALAREVEGISSVPLSERTSLLRRRAARQVAAPEEVMTLSRRIVAEVLGTAFLLAAVVGSGIMGERLADGNIAISLLANTLATGAMLVTLIFTFGPISGAHFNPAVTLADASQGGIGWSDAPAYIVAQVLGAFIGVGAAHLLFGEAFIQVSQHARAGGGQLFSEFVATFGLLCVIWGCARLRSEAVPIAVGLYRRILVHGFYVLC